MRILHVAEIVRGGVGAVLRLNMCTQHEQLGETHARAVVPADQADELDPVPASALRTFERSGRNLKSMLALRSALAREIAAYDPDILHIHSSFAGMIGRLLVPNARRRCKIVYTPHAWSFLMDGSSSQKRVYAALERFLARRTARIICVSKYERDQAIAHGLPADKLDVIYNGVFDYGPPERGRREGEPIRLLFVGRLAQQKGFDLLEAAMDRLRDLPTRLTVVGAPVAPSAAPEPRPNIEHLGWLSHAEVIGQMRRADALVMPSRWEAFAMVPLEAMSCGLPVIASDIGPLREVVSHGETGLIFRSNDVDDLEAALRSIDPSQLDAFGRRSYAAVTTAYSHRKMCLETIGLYRSVMAAKHEQVAAVLP